MVEGDDTETGRVNAGGACRIIAQPPHPHPSFLVVGSPRGDGSWGGGGVHIDLVGSVLPSTPACRTSSCYTGGRLTLPTIILLPPRWFLHGRRTRVRPARSLPCGSFPVGAKRKAPSGFPRWRRRACWASDRAARGSWPTWKGRRRRRCRCSSSARMSSVSGVTRRGLPVSRVPFPRSLVTSFSRHQRARPLPPFHPWRLGYDARCCLLLSWVRRGARKAPQRSAHFRRPRAASVPISQTGIASTGLDRSVAHPAAVHAVSLTHRTCHSGGGTVVGEGMFPRDQSNCTEKCWALLGDGWR